MPRALLMLITPLTPFAWRAPIMPLRRRAPLTPRAPLVFSVLGLRAQAKTRKTMGNARADAQGAT
eukprot:7602866-Lingulodinium_polyedra.AAC.1